MLIEIRLNKIIMYKLIKNENFKEKKTWNYGGLFYFFKLYLCRIYRL